MNKGLNVPPPYDWLWLSQGAITSISIVKNLQNMVLSGEKKVSYKNAWVLEPYLKKIWFLRKERKRIVWKMLTKTVLNIGIKTLKEIFFF